MRFFKKLVAKLKLTYGQKIILTTFDSAYEGTFVSVSKDGRYIIKLNDSGDKLYHVYRSSVIPAPKPIEKGGTE